MGLSPSLLTSTATDRPLLHPLCLRDRRGGARPFARGSPAASREGRASALARPASRMTTDSASLPAIRTQTFLEAAQNASRASQLPQRRENVVAAERQTERGGHAGPS